MADHYETLGISREASAEEIKKAYRRLARELHPDVNPNAGEKFKDVTHAYDILSDPEQRRRYDMGGDSGFGAGGFGAGGFGDIFETFFGGGGSSRSSQPRSRRERGQDSLIRVSLELDEVVFGVHKELEIETAVLCDDCKGSCCRPKTSPVRCDVCGGSGHVQRQARSLLGTIMTTAPCTSCSGYGTTIAQPCLGCNGQGRVRSRRTIGLDIPAGVETGLRLQLPGSGEIGQAGGPHGDLYVEIHVEPHETFSRDGDDLMVTLDVSLTDAILGTTVTVMSLDGEVDLQIRPGVQSGDVLTIKERGVTQLQRNHRGDLKVAVQVVTPTKLDARSRKLVEELADRLQAPKPYLAKAHSGMFAKMRDKFRGR